jgi:hypothetical protein
VPSSRRSVREEDAQVDGHAEDLAGQAEPAERGRAEATDDRGVGEQEQRLGDERGERRDGQPEDPAVAGRPVRAARLGRDHADLVPRPGTRRSGGRGGNR